MQPSRSSVKIGGVHSIFVRLNGVYRCRGVYSYILVRNTDVHDGEHKYTDKI